MNLKRLTGVVLVQVGQNQLVFVALVDGRVDSRVATVDNVVEGATILRVDVDFTLEADYRVTSAWQDLNLCHLFGEVFYLGSLAELMVRD